MTVLEINGLILLGAAAASAAIIEIGKRTVLAGQKRKAKASNAVEADFRAYETSMAMLLFGVALAVVPIGYLVGLETDTSPRLGGIFACLGGLLSRPLYGKVIDPAMGAVSGWIKRRLGGPPDDPPSADAGELPPAITDTWLGK